MGLGTRNTLHEPIPEEQGELSFLDRVNAFGERHARVIIIVSTALIIVTVLIFAQVLWNRTLFDRVERDLAGATSIESLEALRKRYAGSDGEPRILATLGHRYASEGKLEDAKAVYADFLGKYSGHVLSQGVNRSLALVEENIKFLATRKGAAAAAPSLSSHPVQSAKIPDHPLRMGPAKEKHPLVVLKFKGKPDEVRLELYEDEAPNAVAAFMSLANDKYFEGLTFTKVNNEERLRLSPRKDKPSTDELAFERTNRPLEPGALVMVRRAKDNNAAAEFDILLKNASGADEATVFGRVFIESGSAAAQLLQKLEEKDEIESVKIERKRDHEYKPTFVQK